MSKLGYCYKANADYLMKIYLTDRNTPIILCHGNALGQGPIDGKRHGHAWLEINNSVMDFSNGRTVVMEKSKYYKIGYIKYVHRYTAKEAAIMLLKHQNYGPW